jgi:SHS2 domain-containing protein
MWNLAAHTADIAIECTGPSEEAVVADAGAALTAVVTGSDDPRWFAVHEEVDVEVEAPDKPALVVAWLSELLWLLDERGLLWLTGGVTIGGAPTGGFRLTASGNAARYDAATHGRGVEVKAVTYHDLRLAPDRSGKWHLRVLLDI